MLATLKRALNAGAMAGFLIAGAAATSAQTTPDPHHPGGTPPSAAAPGQSQPQITGGMMDPGMMSRMTGGGMMDMMANCPMMGAGASHAEGRIAFLRAELAITDAQKVVWEAYAAQTKKNLQSMQDMQKTMMSMMDAKTPIDRIDARIAMMDKRGQVLKDVKPTLAALYTALSEDQKKKADQILTGMGCMM